MKTYIFYETKGLKRFHLKTFFDISYYRKSSISYIKYGTNEHIPADINELYIIVPKGFPKERVWKLFVKLPLLESYSNQKDYKFSNTISEIKPDFEKNKFTKKTDILFGFIFPDKYKNFDIYHYEYFEDRGLAKKGFVFNSNTDEILILNKYVSSENQTLLHLNN